MGNRKIEENIEGSEGEEVDHLMSRAFVSELDSGDESLFELACNELGNKNARNILKLISNGISTSPEIAERMGLTIQDVILHLTNLEKTGLIRAEKHQHPSLSQRGRSAKSYCISKLAVLLIPNEIVDKRTAQKLLDKEVAKIFKKTLLLSLSAVLGWTIPFFALIYFLLSTVASSSEYASRTTSVTITFNRTVTSMVSNTTVSHTTFAHAVYLSPTGIVILSFMLTLITGSLVFAIFWRVFKKSGKSTKKNS
ncbi:MAG: ArsR/SmtB family transcription factor [Nitrososphaerales archaeon]